MERYLNIIRNLLINVKEVFEQNDLISFGNDALEVIEELVATQVEKTDIYMLNNISIQTIGTKPPHKFIYILGSRT